ncbi:MAG: hypothetical protein J0L73_22880 [Verrucomicrobia bacterium]|nr:hypothetical protein [Verrucomicrobiota bacterium]
MKLFHVKHHLAIIPILVLALAGSASGQAPQPEDYTMLWWADGPPMIRHSTQPPATETLCFQSGTWGMAFDTHAMRALRAGEWPAAMAVKETVQPGRTALADLPAVEWDCAVVVAGRRFTCVGHLETKDSFLQPVRFVESGRFFQRVVIEGLRFVDSDGAAFACAARLEISAWPDRLALRLELEPDALPADGAIELRLGKQRVSAALEKRNSLPLVVFGKDVGPRTVVVADPVLKVGFDEALGCHTLLVPDPARPGKRAPENEDERFDHLDRWPLTLRNDSDEPTVVRVMFIQNHPPDITGFTPMLCEPDGTPTGLPVQTSKNWHQRPEKGVLPHQGPWFHGFAYVRLAPKSSRELVLQIVHARYGGVFAASLAQLSLIGWGTNQFWDQTAIGSFGESICFEPGRAQVRCFITDVRPLMTLSHAKPKPWNWADNCGGGDALMWQDVQGVYQPMRATRTDYRAYGPCLTQASYTEESAGGEMSARMDVSVPRSQDYLRTFIHLRYDVKKPMQWKRLAFFQLGADFYNGTPSRRVAVGDIGGVPEEWEPKRSNQEYDRAPMPMLGEQPWVSIHGLEREGLSEHAAAASRGFIVRKWQAVLGGQPAAQPYVAFFCTKLGKNNRTVVELAPPPGIVKLVPGDYVEADLELVVFPADASDYYGPDEAFKKLLASGADTWKMVQREAAGNALKCEAIHGTVLEAYPLRIAVDAHETAEIIVKGGVGHVPVTFTGLNASKGYILTVDGQGLDQSVNGNDFWQTDYDSSVQSWRQTFNIPLPAGQPHTLRFAADPRP